MKITFKNNTSFDANMYPSGTMFAAESDGYDIVVIKVHSELYVAIYDEAVGDRAYSVSFNTNWYGGWTNPRPLTKGDTVTITV